jgi:hypothetical protein
MAARGARAAAGDAGHWLSQWCKGGVAVNEKEILALDDKRFGAMIARDFKALEAMVHGDLLYTHSSGVTDTKASWLQSMQSGKTKYKSVNCTDRKVRVIGEVALIRGAQRSRPRLAASRAA